jgi:hypothetical protein
MAHEVLDHVLVLSYSLFLTGDISIESLDSINRKVRYTNLTKR